MHPTSTFAAILLPALALALPSGLNSLDTRQSSAIQCGPWGNTAVNTAPPSCPGGCCGYELFTSSPGSACDPNKPKPSTFSTMSIASAASSWTSGCSAIVNDLNANPREYILESWSTSAWNTVVSGSGCAFQISTSTTFSDTGGDGIQITSADIAYIMSNAISHTNGGASGVTSSWSCWAVGLTWRMVPA